MYSVQASWFSSNFPSRHRYLGVSLSYQLGTILGGGIVPILASVFLISEPSVFKTLVFLVYIFFIAFLSYFAALITSEKVIN